MPNTLAAYTIVVLHHADKYLLLKRAPTKKLFPNLFTGIGGRVEAHEYTALRESALRELLEESGVAATAVENFTLRRALLHARDDLTLLLYFTADLKTYTLPACPEGTLMWVSPADFSQIEFIETARDVIPLLVTDQQRDPQGQEAVKLGLAVYVEGRLEKLIWE